MATAGKPITCRAAVTWEKLQPCSVETVEVAPPKAGEIRVKMAATGICFSDVSLAKGFFPQLEFPTVLGHEGIGTVESVGTGVSSFSVGDTVIPLWTVSCGKCRWCVRDRRNICQLINETMTGRIYLDKTKRISSKGQEISQAMGLGLFSEYVVLPEIAAVKVKVNGPLEKIAPYGCCVPTGYGAAVHSVKVDEGSTVAIWGLGAIGLCAALGCRDAKAARIIGIDINPDKFEYGKKFGCTEFINPQDHKKPVSAVLKEMTHGLGVDFAIVCVGRMDVMEDAVDGLSPGASECVILGIGANGEKFPVNHTDLITGKVVKGSWCGDCRCTKDLPDLVSKYAKGTMPTDALITHTISLDEINNGFDLLKSGQAIRAVVKF